MVCPKCKKLGIPGSFFCSQEALPEECFGLEASEFQSQHVGL